ncbi:MAG TPA: AAA family ATPase, partial [Thermomicrobiales bacterium]|nr:AAA family ATPase [Thermomicrobiales bacterium]
MGDTQHVEPASPLPRPRTSFIGREREVAEAGCLLASDDVALLTLTGPGGVGKTRLALQAAASAAGAFPDGVAFASLASVADPRLVLREIAQALGIQDAGNQPIAGALVGWLRGRAMLLVLDNLEHVIEVAPEIAGLLDACPRLTILAASRVPLRVSAEHEFQVASLTLPERVDSASLDVANRSSAIELFVE